MLTANANTITLSVDPNLPPTLTSYVLGAVNPGAPADPADVAAYINGIISLPLGGSGVVNGNNIYRSLNTFEPLQAVTAVDSLSGISTTVVEPGYYYLAAKYDGPCGGTAVWYLDNLGPATFVIPQYAFGKDNAQYGLSGWTLFNPDDPSVPDGGSTLLMGLFGLGLVMGVRKFAIA